MLFKEWASCLDKQTGQVTLDCISVVFQNLVSAAFVFVSLVALVFVIVAGIKFTLSGGDPKQVEGARKTLTYAIIGLLLVLLSVFLLNLIAFVTGAQCIKFFGFSSCP